MQKLEDNASIQEETNSVRQKITIKEAQFMQEIRDKELIITKIRALEKENINLQYELSQFKKERRSSYQKEDPTRQVVEQRPTVSQRRYSDENTVRKLSGGEDQGDEDVLNRIRRNLGSGDNEVADAKNVFK
eukprot:TRINITY_DN2748_c0_g1_i1.p1 TRINITY_DN2748_c0_g1~~TRINITY_DN2748_c0_g1_i1.p1  ORF type:complete len:132 (-),score=31.40 TRINITY_DN2748_c0_g1_i1:103-498(-)